MMNVPAQIADWLVQEHGPDGAYKAALDGALEAQREGDNYRLSVWREVKRVLATRKATESDEAR